MSANLFTDFTWLKSTIASISSSSGSGAQNLWSASVDTFWLSESNSDEYLLFTFVEQLIVRSIRSVQPRSSIHFGSSYKNFTIRIKETRERYVSTMQLFCALDRKFSLTSRFRKQAGNIVNLKKQQKVYMKI